MTTKSFIIVLFLVFSIFTLTINLSAQTTGTFIDKRDRHEYKWTKIGEQIWMAENLAYDTNSDRDKYWFDCSVGYEFDESLEKIYGRLYNWETALKVCPSGWHLPTDDEWKTLELAIGMSQLEVDKVGARGTNEGAKLKSTYGWKSGDKGTDDYGFSALPGGYCLRYMNDYYRIGQWGQWWCATTTEKDKNSAWIRYLVGGFDKDIRSGFSKNDYLNIRCVKD